MKQAAIRWNQLPFAGIIRLILGSMFAMFFFTACATGVDHVKLYEPLEYKPSKEAVIKEAEAAAYASGATTPKIKIALNRVKDSRQDISCIGAKKNTYGIKMGKVDVEEGVVFVDLFRQHLITSFQKAGYEIVPYKSSNPGSVDKTDDVKAIVDAEVRSFWVEFMPGVFVVDAESDVSFDVRLKDIGHREIWEETFRGKGKVSSGIAITRSMFEESINLAYSEAMNKFYTSVSGDEFRSLLMK